MITIPVPHRNKLRLVRRICRLMKSSHMRSPRSRPRDEFVAHTLQAIGPSRSDAMELLFFGTLSVTVRKDGPFPLHLTEFFLTSLRVERTYVVGSSSPICSAAASLRPFFFGSLCPYSVQTTKITPFRINQLRNAFLACLFLRFRGVGRSVLLLPGHELRRRSRLRGPDSAAACLSFQHSIGDG